MQEIRITISDLPEEDKIALSKLVSDNCNIEETRSADGATNEIITILAENPILCGIAANILTEVVKAIATRSHGTGSKSPLKCPMAQTLSILERQSSHN